MYRELLFIKFEFMKIVDTYVIKLLVCTSLTLQFPQIFSHIQFYVCLQNVWIGFYVFRFVYSVLKDVLSV